MKKAVKKWRMSKSTSSNGLQGSTESEKHDDEKPEKALSDTELANVDGTGSLGKVSNSLLFLMGAKFIFLLIYSIENYLRENKYFYWLMIS